MHFVLSLEIFQTILCLKTDTGISKTKRLGLPKVSKKSSNICPTSQSHPKCCWLQLVLLQFTVATATVKKFNGFPAVVLSCLLLPKQGVCMHLWCLMHCTACLECYIDY